MRILFLTHRLPYAPNRGDRVRSYHMLRTLARHAEVDVFSLVHGADEEARTADLRGIASRVVTARVARLRKVRRALAALATGGTLTHALLDAPGASSALAKLVAERPPDVVLAYCSGMARFALEAPLERFPLVLDMVDVDSVKWAALAKKAAPPRRWIYAREARKLAPFEAAVARRAFATLVVNEREREALAAIAPGARVEVIQNGVDVEALRPGDPPAEGPEVVFCGVLDYPPNERAALWLIDRIWPAVRARRGDVRLNLVGANPTRAIRRAAPRDGSIHVTGTVPDVRPHLWRSSVSVAPLEVAMGIQNKVLEATAAGLPSVVTPAVMNGLPPEVKGACSPARTADDFATEILSLLSRSPGERRARAGASRLDSLAWPERLRSLAPLLAAAGNVA